MVASADGLGAMSAEEIVAALRTGRSVGRAVIGQPMKDVVIHSTEDMRDADLTAIAAYLKTLPPGPAGPASYAADDKTADDLKAGRDNSRGPSFTLTIAQPVIVRTAMAKPRPSRPSPATHRCWLPIPVR
jgi:hypothetical protein